MKFRERNNRVLLIHSSSHSFPKTYLCTQVHRYNWDDEVLQEVPHLPLSDLLKAGSVMRSDQAAQALSSHFYPVVQVTIKVYFLSPRSLIFFFLLGFLPYFIPLRNFFHFIFYHIIRLCNTHSLKHQPEPMCPEPVIIVKV